MSTGIYLSVNSKTKSWKQLKWNVHPTLVLIPSPNTHLASKDLNLYIRGNHCSEKYFIYFLNNNDMPVWLKVSCSFTSLLTKITMLFATRSWLICTVSRQWVPREYSASLQDVPGSTLQVSGMFQVVLCKSPGCSR